MWHTHEEDEHRSDEGLRPRTNINRVRTGSGVASIGMRRRFGVRPKHVEHHPQGDVYYESVATGYYSDAPRGHWLNRQIELMRDSD